MITERANIQLFNMDCMEAMAKMPDNSVDLIITSPPYNLGNQHHTGNIRHCPYNDDLPENEYREWQVSILNECFRILKQEGSVFYNHKNRIKDGVQISPYEWLLKTNLIIKQEVVWFNGSQNFDKCRFYPMTERVYWLSKQKDTKFNNNINHHDLFNWTPEGTAQQHKRSFPTAMVKDILRCFDHGLVFDPFMGSGTVGICCWDEGFDFIGTEIDKDYYTAAVARLERHKAQGQLF